MAEIYASLEPLLASPPLPPLPGAIHLHEFYDGDIMSLTRKDVDQTTIYGRPAIRLAPSTTVCVRSLATGIGRTHIALMPFGVMVAGLAQLTPAR